MNLPDEYGPDSENYHDRHPVVALPSKLTLAYAFAFVVVIFYTVRFG
jgi:hypothetical protein